MQIGHSAEGGKTDRKQMSQQRLRRWAGFLRDGATASCVSFRLSVKREPERAGHWHSEKRLTENRGPHLLMRSHMHISLDWRRRLRVRACSRGPHWQKLGELVEWADAQRRREIGGLSQQTVEMSVCVCMCVSVWERVNEITFPKPPLVLLALALCVLSRDRTSHVRFQNSSQFLSQKDAHILNAIFTTARGSFSSNRVQLWYKSTAF